MNIKGFIDASVRYNSVSLGPKFRTFMSFTKVGSRAFFFNSPHVNSAILRHLWALRKLFLNDVSFLKHYKCDV